MIVVGLTRWLGNWLLAWIQMTERVLGDVRWSLRRQDKSSRVFRPTVVLYFCDALEVCDAGCLLMAVGVQVHSGFWVCRSVVGAWGRGPRECGVCDVQRELVARGWIWAENRSATRYVGPMQLQYTMSATVYDASNPSPGSRTDWCCAAFLLRNHGCYLVGEGEWRDHGRETGAQKAPVQSDNGSEEEKREAPPGRGAPFRLGSGLATRERSVGGGSHTGREF